MQWKEESVYLKNYTEFIESSAAIIKSAGIENTAILYADITGFQLINDYYGFTEGDRFLKYLGMFLSQLPGTKACARVFSDHFIALETFSEDINLNESAIFYEKMFLEFLEQQYMFHPNCKVGIACGICILEKGTNTLVKAIDNANLARKESKGIGHTAVTLFHDAMSEKVRKQKDMQIHIQSAFRKQEFIFYLQPKVNLQTGKIIGAEALARWIRRDGSMIFPDEFIPTMEKDGTIVELDFVIYRQVCEYIYERIKTGKPLIPVSVNMSRVHIGRRDFAEKIHEVAEQYHIPPYLLEFELTETVLLEEFNDTKQIIDCLREYGYKISIDDFGTGFTGINVWKELDFDVLKLDKTFISEDKLVMQKNDTIITSITYVGKKMQTALLCEGVETMEQCRHMKELGSEIGQGYYFSPPVSADEFDLIFEKNDGYFLLPWVTDSKVGLAPEYLETEEISPTQMRSITHSLIHIMPCGMAGLDEKSEKLLFLSDKVLEIFGYTREDFVINKEERWIYKIMPEKMNPELAVEYRNRFKRDGYLSLEYTANNKQGFNININLYAARVSTPEFGTYVLCCFFDDTERKKAILLAEETESRLDTLIQTFHAGMVKLDLRNDYDIIYVSDSYFEMLGYTKEEVISEQFRNYLKNLMRNSFQKMKDGLEQILSGEKNHIEYQITKKDGTSFWTAVYITNIQKKEKNVIADILFLDITKDKKMEKLSERLDMVVENTPGDIAVITLTGDKLNIQFLTAGTFKMAGYEKEEFYTMQKDNNGLGLISEKDRKAIAEEIFQGCKNKKQINYNFQFLNRKGILDWHNLSANYSHETEYGEIVYHGIFTNINQLKQKEEALKRSEVRYRAAAELANTDIWSYDFQLKQLELPSTEELSHLKLNGKKVLSIEEFIHEGHIHPDYLEVYYGIYRNIEAGSNHEEAILMAKTMEGKYEWFRIRCKVVAWTETGAPLELVSVSENIHAKRSSQAQISELKNMAFKDSLTGSYNHDGTRKIIGERLQKLLNKDEKAAFLLIDIDNFKSVNISLGHQIGNALLTNLCIQIRKLLPAHSVLGRFGGDEFIVYIDHITDESEVYRLADILCDAAEAVLCEIKDGMTISVGISFAESGMDFDILYQLAEEVIFKVKQKRN